jgi:hypothetical protein
MSLLSPLFLLGGLAATIPILLHLLKREPEIRVKFAAVQLLRTAPVETSRRQRRRELRLLALRIAGLLLLALAFARPFVAASTAAGGTGATIVALDTSLSMSAPGRFERAQQLATGTIRNAPSRDWTALVLFGTTAQIASPLSADRGAALAAIGGARTTPAGTRYRSGLTAAANLLRGRPGRIVVISDLQASGWDVGDRVSVPPGTEVEVVDVAAATPNLAVTAAHVADGRIVATVRNAGTAARDARLRLRVHAATDAAAQATSPVNDTTVPVAPGETSDVTFPVPAGQWAVVSVDDPGGTAGDDARYLILDSASRPAVLVVTATGESGREGLYVEQALLASGTGGAAYGVEDVSGAGLQAWDQKRLDAHTAVVILSTRGLDHHGRELLSTYAKNGGGVLLAAGGDIDGEVVSDVLGGLVSVVPPAEGPPAGARTLAPVDARHPVLRAFAGRATLARVRFQRVSNLRAPSCQALARFTSGESALVECAPGSGRALVLASDLGKVWNDFPLHPTFVPFVHEAVQYLADTRRTADYLIGDTPEGVPPGPGVVAQAASTGVPGRLVAVNVDPAESDSGRLTADEFRTAVTRSEGVAGAVERREAVDQEERQHIWQYVLMLMIGAMIVEGVVAARTA